MRITRISHLVFASALVLICSAQNKMQGVCLTGPPKEIDSSTFSELREIGAEWVCLMPYAYGSDKDSKLTYDTNWQWWGESFEGAQAMILMARERGMKVMLKPHLWLRHGAFTGSFDAGSDEAWAEFEASYEKYILKYAHLAEQENVEVFCIGTELERFVSLRLNFWQRLIDKVSNIYSGKLTYAANWDEVTRFPLWKRMDLIGIDGYFPLTIGPSNDLTEMSDSWKRHVSFLDSVSASLERPFMFCEIGYRSCKDCTSKPWEHSESKPIDNECQAKAYQAFFKEIRRSKHYQGCFLWKWHSNIGPNDMQGSEFTPQFKPALSVVKQAFRL